MSWQAVLALPLSTTFGTMAVVVLEARSNGPDLLSSTVGAMLSRAGFVPVPVRTSRPRVGSQQPRTCQPSTLTSRRPEPRPGDDQERLGNRLVKGVFPGRVHGGGERVIMPPTLIKILGRSLDEVVAFLLISPEV